MKFKDLSKKWRLLVILLTAISLLLVIFNAGFAYFLHEYRVSSAQERKAMKKADADLLGKRLSISREGEKPVQVDYYVPAKHKQAALPLVFNIHGGGFVAGDADALDTQSQRLAQQWDAVIVSVNYTTADVKPISYGVDEIADAVRYFYDHQKEYQLDPEEIYMIGYSAGAYYAAETARALRQEKDHLAGLIMCYPWTTGLPDKAFGKDWPRTLFILAGQDPISQRAKSYLARMKQAGVKTDVQEYGDAQHSFIESNNPEGLRDPSPDAKKVINQKQEKLARKAEGKIGKWMCQISSKAE